MSDVLMTIACKLIEGTLDLEISELNQAQPLAPINYDKNTTKYTIRSHCIFH